MASQVERKQRISPEPAYQNAQLVAHDLLWRIGQMLSDMPAPGSIDEPIRWCHVDDVFEVNRQLLEVYKFLGGTDE